MANITLENIRHCYGGTAKSDDDWALKHMQVTWEDGGAYALLGPSGCGKTTLLNIISGLLQPSEGRVLFNGQDVTELPPDQREIAQVFQFPVVYDTMTVYDNLAFPLRNRGVDRQEVHRRVTHIAEMLELDGELKKRAANLTADGKQKISLGRGLVRSDVNVIMFDEPLTVIDPHLKWTLRSKLKELHQQVGATMIYVTHDQTEAMTFADRVVVMHDGRVVQEGTPVELFEHPAHTFVGHFIGSPGMNLIPCELQGGRAVLSGQAMKTSWAFQLPESGAEMHLGVRPEFVRFADDGVPVQLQQVDDVGRYRLATTLHNETLIKVVVPEGEALPERGPCHVRFDPQFTHVYANGWRLPPAQS